MAKKILFFLFLFLATTVTAQNYGVPIETTTSPTCEFLQGYYSAGNDFFKILLQVAAVVVGYDILSSLTKGIYKKYKIETSKKNVQLKKSR